MHPFVWFAVPFLVCSACQAPRARSRQPDAGSEIGRQPAVDAGDNDPGDDDAGPDAGCAGTGFFCTPGLLCCSPNDICDPALNICTTNPGIVGVGTDAGAADSGAPLPADNTVWVPEDVFGDVAVLNSLSTPSSTLQLGAGSGGSVGQVLMRSTEDGGWWPLTGAPGATDLYDVWADPAGDVFAVGANDGGPVLLAGTVDGGLATIDLDGSMPANPNADLSSLQAVRGLGPGEAIAVGAIPLSAFTLQTEALHLLPDGGLATELLPDDISNTYRLAGGVDGGPIYALAELWNPDFKKSVLTRVNGVWKVLGQLPPPVSCGTVCQSNAADIAVGEAGDITVVGDDGDGQGIVYAFAAGRFEQVLSIPALPPLTAICEPSPGEFFIATWDERTSTAGIQRVMNGIQSGQWYSETIRATVDLIDAISYDGVVPFAAGFEQGNLPIALIRITE